MFTTINMKKVLIFDSKRRSLRCTVAGLVCALASMASMPLTSWADTSGVADANLRLRYDFEQVTGNTVSDASDNGHAATLCNNATVTAMGKYHVLSLGTGTGYLDMGSGTGNEIKQLTDFTVSVYYYVNSDASLSGNGFFLWAFSSLAANTATSGPYMAYRLNAQRFATSTGGYNNEKGIAVGAASAKGKWIHVLYRQTGTKGELYIDGKLAGTNAAEPLPSSAFTAAPAYNWIGRAPFGSDSYLTGTMVYDFRLYNAAASDAQVAQWAALTDSLDHELLYGTPGDNTALAAAVAKYKAVLAGLTVTDYPAAVVAELSDDIAIAQQIVNGKKAAQTVLDSWVTTLQTAYNQLAATKGLILLTNTDNTYDASRGFRHPGCLNTQDDFDRVKQQLSDGNATVTAALSKLRSSTYASASFTTYPTETIVRGGGVGENYMNAARGAAAAYQNALLWKITGETAHAACAVRILNAWRASCKHIGGDTNYALAAGIYGYEFANAAELMRDYEGWRQSDFEAFQTWMLNVWYPSAIGFLRGRNGTWENTGKWWQAPGHYWSNWGLCNTLCVMSIGILCDDAFIYNQGLSYYKYDQVGSFKNLPSGDQTAWNWGLCEYIGNLVPIESDCPDSLVSPFGKISQMQESGRDQGHATFAVGLAADVCQTGLNQGDDLYALMDNRLAGGIEHVAAYNFAGKSKLPFCKYRIQTTGFSLSDGRGGTHTSDAGGAQGARPYWARILAYYEGTKGIKMTYSEEAAKAMGIDAGGGTYGETSGGFDHLGFTTLMCTKPATTSDKATYTLTTSITLPDGTVMPHNELGGLKNTYTPDNNTGVAKGTKLTLTAALPAGATDDGTWLWDSGQTSNTRQITADRSQLCRVTYTAANGVKSTALFSIAVQGDCRADNLTPYITTGGSTVNDTVISLKAMQPFTLGANNSGGWGTYQWSTGATTSSITVSNIASDRVYTLNYKNQGGRVSVVNFHIHAYVMSPSLSVNGGTVQYVDSIVAEQGQDVKLMPVTADENTFGDWLWSTGETTRTLTLDDVQKTGRYTVSYTMGDLTESHTFQVLVADSTKVPADGDYYIRNAADGKYLTNKGTIIPVFTDLAASSDMQVWTITKDGGRFKVVLKSSGKFLDNFGHFTTKDYDAEAYTYIFEGVDATNYYSICDGGTSATYYWGVNTSYDYLVGRFSQTRNGYPFELVPYDPTSIRNTTKQTLRIYPNPATNYITVEQGAEFQGPSTLRIHSANGALVKTATLDSTKTQIDVSAFPSGLYIVNAGNRNMKFIKR
jgi:hypothetical protein